MGPHTEPSSQQQRRQKTSSWQTTSGTCSKSELHIPSFQHPPSCPVSTSPLFLFYSFSPLILIPVSHTHSNFLCQSQNIQSISIQFLFQSHTIQNYSVSFKIQFFISVSYQAIQIYYSIFQPNPLMHMRMLCVQCVKSISQWLL